MKASEHYYYLAIESSCDDTSVAVLQGSKVLSNVVAQQEVHEEFGGVVPELASRAHQKNIVPVTEVALRRAGVKKEDLAFIAYTKGPGLLGSLHVGSSFAKSLSLALNIPLVESHHMQAHVLAHFLEDEDSHPVPEWPFMCLTVSGGHTQIVLAKGPTNLEVVGETIDDAAGEAFDKAAKIMGLPYPGGPLVDKLAKEGDPHRYAFAQPKIEGYNFSFSGLKTSFLYTLRKLVADNPNYVEENKADIAASLEHTIVSMLCNKFFRAAEEYKIRDVAIAGGVSANTGLRKTFTEEAKKRGMRPFIPPFQYCTDNAAMIGISGWFNYRQGIIGELSSSPMARWKM